MGPMTLILGGGAALALAYLMKKGGSAQQLTPEQKEQLSVVGTPVTGRSGKQWVTMLAAEPVGDFYTMNVLAMPGEFGPHELMPVLAYRQTGDDQTSRVLVSTAAPTDVPGVAIQTAIEDFGIATGPTGGISGCVGCI